MRPSHKGGVGGVVPLTLDDLRSLRTLNYLNHGSRVMDYHLSFITYYIVYNFMIRVYYQK